MSLRRIGFSFFRILGFGFFRILDSTLVLLRIGYRLFLSDWIYQKYINGCYHESAGSLDYIVSLRIVSLHKSTKHFKINML